MTAQYGAIPKPAAPTYDFWTIWYDEASESLYSFSGEESYLGIKPKVLALWKLSIDGKGSETWTQNTSYGDPPFYQGLTRPLGGAAACTSDTGFYLGGYSSDHSGPATQDLHSFISTPGLVSYDSKTRTWSNTTTGLLDLSPTGLLPMGRSGTHSFGPNGLLAI